MPAAFLASWIGWLRLGGWLIASIPAEGRSAIARRCLIFLIGWPAMGLLNLWQWLGFLVDEIIFPQYRNVHVRQPVFIIGIPRSGTTYLQRVLAKDENFSTLTLLECLLAPSISQRYLLNAILRLPWPRASAEQHKGGGRMDSIHEIRASEPEEDFLLLLCQQACFLGVVACPTPEHFWKIGHFDEALTTRERHRIMRFYHRCLQKHLYFHGQELTLLSKNPSFTPMITSLRETFPDCRVITCIRTPTETVPSQLSALLPALELLGAPRLRPEFGQRMVALLLHYYQRIAATGDCYVVPMSRINNDLESVLAELYAFCDMVPSSDFVAQMDTLARDGRTYQSGHRYSLEDFGMTEQEINATFGDLWRRLSGDAVES